MTFDVDEVLGRHWHDLAPLRNPVLVVALQGLFDVSEVATSAVEWVLDDRDAVVVADIDPDPFFDFTQQRPHVYFDDDGERRLRWPENEFTVVRFPDGLRDLVVLDGVEPHLGWPTFARCVVDVARGLGCGLLVSLGAVAEQVPHTRVPTVVGSTTNDELARRLGLDKPRYQGPTGVAGVLLDELDRNGIPSVSLRVGVPHYLAAAQHPKSTAALLRHLEHVLGVPTNHQRLVDEIDRWQELHDAAVAGDPRAVEYVASLEQRVDRALEQAVPSGEDLAAELEEFLRGLSDDDGRSADGDAS